MHYHILGAGSIGCLMAYHLRRLGHDVTLLMRNAEKLAHFQRGGEKVKITWPGNRSTWVTPGIKSLLTNNLGVEPFKRIIVTTKAYQVIDALKSVKDNIDNDSYLIFLQNGIGSLENGLQLLKSWDKLPRIIVGSTDHGCYMNPEDPFHVFHVALNSFNLCAPDERFSPLLENNRQSSFQSIWEDFSHIESTIRLDLDPKEMMDILYLKLAMNACINPIASLLKSYNGEILNNKLAKSMISNLCKEISQIYKKMEPTSKNEILSNPEKLNNRVLESIEMVKLNYCSMLVDVENGRKTENDFINGYLRNKGMELNISTPVNNALYYMIKDIESRFPKQ